MEEIIACVQSEMVMGSSELRTLKQELYDMKLFRKVWKKIH